MPRIRISNRQRSVKPDTAWLGRFSRIALGECLRHSADGEPVLAGLESVDVVLVSDKVMADAHQRFMNIAGPTDVLTFDHGEILICAPLARINAAKYGKSLEQEIGLYLIHGLLHLNGFTDKTPGEALRIKKLQNKILNKCLNARNSRWN